MAEYQRRAKAETVLALSFTELQEPYLSVFLKVLRIIIRFAKRRHAFAHGVWGVVEAVPDALLLIDAKHLFRHWGAANDFRAAPNHKRFN